MRCHLMIGAAASGKTTAARHLAATIQQSEGVAPAYISSADIRLELYGHARVIANWQAVECRIQELLSAALLAGRPVILEACYVRRCYRLAITQALALPQPISWIGWWLDTPLEQCLQWNERKPQPVPEWVVRKHCAQILCGSGEPLRCEGFAVVVRLEAARADDLAARIQQEYQRLEQRSQAGTLRERAYELHAYSRLLDLERLLYLMVLLSRHPQLPVTGEPEDPELQQLLSPLPGEDLPSQAAALLARRHGACYGDPLAVAADLHWLEMQGFRRPSAPAAAAAANPLETLPAIMPPPWPSGVARPSGGLPSLADQPRFVRALTLLHHPGTCCPGVRIEDHLAACLNRAAATAQPWRGREVRQLIATTLSPYGFQPAGSSGRGVLQQAEALALRLQQAGVLPPPPPPPPERLAVIGDGATERMALRRRLEQAIGERQRLELTCHSHGGGGELRCWPLQLLLQRGQWWLLVEQDPIGQPEGLLMALPLALLGWRGRRDGLVRSEQRQRQALQRADVLRSLCGGMALGNELAAQQALCRAPARERSHLLQTLRLRATAAAMAVLVEELQQLQPHCVRAAAALPGDHWLALPQSCNQLAASSGDSHPYPLEIDLPPWVITADGELRRWLFSLGSTIRIDAPAALRQEHRRWLAAALALHQSDDADTDPEITASWGAAAQALTDPGNHRRRISKTMSSRRTEQKPSAAP